MPTFVALVADAACRYASVVVDADSWSLAIDQLEDIGCEVIEDQTVDYEPEDLADVKTYPEIGLLTINKLINDTDFIPN